MEPTTLATSLPTALSWYQNPYFAASFGIVVALGSLTFALAYFVFVKLKVGQTRDSGTTDKCERCQLTEETLSRIIPCKMHSGLEARLSSVENWQRQHDADYRALANRINDMERGNKK